MRYRLGVDLDLRFNVFYITEKFCCCRVVACGLIVVGGDQDSSSILCDRCLFSS